MNKWQKFQQLSNAERYLLVQALFLLPLTACALQLLGFKRLYAALTRFVGLSSQPSSHSVDPLAYASRLAHLVQIAAYQRWYRANCLQQSLVLWWLLRRQEIASELKIGVRKEENQLAAHAWVEYQGVVLNDRSDIYLNYTPFVDAIDPWKVRSP